MTATLLLNRNMPGPTIALADRHRSWQILLDGDPAGEIAPEESKELAVEPGPHTLQLTATGKRRSPERTFTAAEESVTEYACHVQPILPLLLMALVIPHRWIALKRR